MQSMLIDNSAWARLNDRRLPDAVAAEVADALEAGDLYACAPFVLEAGYSAQSSVEHRHLLDELLSLPWASVDTAVERAALEGQRELAAAGHHRLPPVDLLIAALAHVHGLGVLHYDKDFDVIAQRTSLRFASNWLVIAGSL